MPGPRNSHQNIFLWYCFDFVKYVILGIISEYNSLNLVLRFPNPALSVNSIISNGYHLVIILQQCFRPRFRTSNDTVILYCDIWMHFQTDESSDICGRVREMIFLVFAYCDENALVEFSRIYFDGYKLDSKGRGRYTSSCETR